jgi:hypothetical protein
MEQIRELKDFVDSLKMENNNLKKDREERMEIQEELQEEIRTFRVINKELKKVNVYLPSLRMKVPDHVYVFGSLLLQ